MRLTWVKALVTRVRRKKVLVALVRWKWRLLALLWEYRGVLREFVILRQACLLAEGQEQLSQKASHLVQLGRGLFSRD